MRASKLKWKKLIKDNGTKKRHGSQCQIYPIEIIDSFSPSPFHFPFNCLYRMGPGPNRAFLFGFFLVSIGLKTRDFCLNKLNLIGHPNTRKINLINSFGRYLPLPTPVLLFLNQINIPPDFFQPFLSFRVYRS